MTSFFILGVMIGVTLGLIVGSYMTIQDIKYCHNIGFYNNTPNKQFCDNVGAKP